MIWDAENIAQGTQFPQGCAKGSGFNGIKHIYFVKRGFSFSTLAAFQDSAEWTQAIKGGYIFPFLGNKNIDDQSETVQTEVSAQGITFRKSDGKYRFIHYFNYVYDYAAVLKGFSEGDYDYMFTDRNGNTLAYSPDGTTVRGFDLDSLIVEKMNIGSTEPNWTKVGIELSEAAQLDRFAVTVNAKVSGWRPGRVLNLVPVKIIEIEEGSLRFRVLDLQYNTPVSGLQAADITIDDNTGAITFTDFQSLGNGYYFLDGLSAALTYGTVNVNTRIYYGSGNYTFGNAPVSIINIAFNSLTDFEFDVRLDLDNSAVEGLEIADFTITDDTNGAISIGSLVEFPAGHYRLSSLSDDLTTGTIAISGNYMGSANYSSSVAVDIYDITNTYPWVLYFKVRETVSGDPVTGLLKADFTVTDSILGVVPIYTLIRPAPGEYIITASGLPLSTGVIDISDIVYNGSENYDITGATIRNGGYLSETGVTDWVDSDGDGRADYIWGAALSGMVFSIISGDPDFTGRAQKFEVSGIYRAFSMYPNFYGIGRTYKLHIKYKGTAGSPGGVSIISDGRYSIDYIPFIGDETARISYGSEFTVLPSDTELRIYISVGSSGQYVIIDELYLIEVL